MLLIGGILYICFILVVICMCVVSAREEESINREFKNLEGYSGIDKMSQPDQRPEITNS